MKQVKIKPAQSKFNINEFLMEKSPTVDQVLLEDLKELIEIRIQRHSQV